MESFFLDFIPIESEKKKSGHHLSRRGNRLYFLWGPVCRSSSILPTVLWSPLCSGAPKFHRRYVPMQKFVFVSLETRLTVCESSIRRLFWSSISKSGTHLADNLLISKYLCRILCTRLVEMPTISSFSLTFNLRSTNIILWNFSSISSFVISFGGPLRHWSTQLIRPHLSSAIQ